MRRIHRTVKHVAPEVTLSTRDYVMRVDGQLQDMHGYFEEGLYYCHTDRHPPDFEMYTVSGYKVDKHAVSLGYPRPTDRLEVDHNDEVTVVFEYLSTVAFLIEAVDAEAAEVRNFVDELEHA